MINTNTGIQTNAMIKAITQTSTGIKTFSLMKHYRMTNIEENQHYKVNNSTNTNTKMDATLLIIKINTNIRMKSYTSSKINTLKLTITLKSTTPPLRV